MIKVSTVTIYFWEMYIHVLFKTKEMEREIEMVDSVTYLNKNKFIFKLVT